MASPVSGPSVYQEENDSIEHARSYDRNTPRQQGSGATMASKPFTALISAG
jgi:hypothetical protein